MERTGIVHQKSSNLEEWEVKVRKSEGINRSISQPSEMEASYINHSVLLTQSLGKCLNCDLFSWLQSYPGHTNKRPEFDCSC
jgi:hypothetical protein